MDLQPNSPQEQPDVGMSPQRAWLDGLKEVESMAVIFSAIFVGVVIWIDSEMQKAVDNHKRSERLAAYRVRNRWKRSDLKPLLSIGVNEYAQRRMAKLEGRGRPVVKMHQTVGEAFCERLATSLNMLRDDATPEERRRSFRIWPWWKHHVEAYYRGELASAKVRRIKGPSEHAERTVGLALGMSQASVHAICGEIRKLRREDREYSDFPARTLAHYDRWISDGWKPNQVEDA